MMAPEYFVTHDLTFKGQPGPAISYNYLNFCGIPIMATIIIPGNRFIQDITNPFYFKKLLKHRNY